MSEPERKLTKEETEFLCQRIIELAETRPEFRQRLDDLVLASQTNQAPNSKAFQTLQNIRDGLKTLDEKEED